MVRHSAPSTCSLAPNVLSAHCPTRHALDLIADKWTTLLIYLLARGKQRYGDLHRQVGGISQKMLTQTLRKLERDGLVTRHVYPEVPPRTEYELTKLGHTLIGPMGALCEWAGAHLAELEQARARYDQLQKKPSLSA
ncbi:helix-turn-helix domain-containing protein [Geothrix sp. 21YS21S-4]|uniref:winged helix-turn-helix transcriptional regulator n=1 Tax=Geothrix sp. 21YS21S-4 TaxID=3068889 RepID=UPI0027B8DA97|nr:helix-turn-helix domain-containing protein [Geothrix sp. 21YS21S-4]